MDTVLPQITKPARLTNLGSRAVTTVIRGIRSGVGISATVVIFTVAFFTAIAICAVLQILVLEVTSRAGVFPLAGFFVLNLILVIIFVHIALNGHRVSQTFRYISAPLLATFAQRKSQRRMVNGGQGMSAVLLIIRRHSAEKVKSKSATA